MSLDVESLLAPLSDETPSGENLEYDPEYIELEMAAERKPDQQFGDTIVPGEEPDWNDVANRAVSLLGRTRDLRVAIHLVQAALRNDGFPGFRDALAVIDGYLERLWDSVHPQLDPDDDLDPTMRVNLLRTLCNVQAVVKPIREAPLARSRMLGIASTQLVQSAEAPRGEDGGEAGPSRADLDAVFMDCDLDEFRATVEALRESLRLVRHLEAALTDRVGAGNAFDMSPLVAALKEADGIAGAWLVRRDGSGDAATGEAEGGGTGAQEAGSGGGASSASGRAMRAGVHSREDVLRGLDEMIRFFEANEPTSPVPLLLGRAKRWMSMDFLAILEDFSPDAAREAEKLRGSN
ncbi:MAG: type VI secretion system protein TssA [Gammaproteobacteria bacterium]|nr:type VI secretion system protein TssA [Gammaproteobacteria bacterium]